MIIETPYKANDTITIKTVGGEELVARFVEETDAVLKITKPLALVAHGQGVGLGPWCFTVDAAATLTLQRSNILFINKTESTMANQYVTATTGVQLA